MGSIEDAEAAKYISQGSGFLGTCLEYLNNTASHLQKNGMPDKYLNRLQAMVSQLKVS